MEKLFVSNNSKHTRIIALGFAILTICHGPGLMLAKATILMYAIESLMLLIWLHVYHAGGSVITFELEVNQAPNRGKIRFKRIM